MKRSLMVSAFAIVSAAALQSQAPAAVPCPRSQTTDLNVIISAAVSCVGRVGPTVTARPLNRFVLAPTVPGQAVIEGVTPGGVNDNSLTRNRGCEHEPV